MRIFMTALGTLGLLFASPVLAASPNLTNDDQKTLYALGLAISQSLGPFTLNEAELDIVKSGMVDGVLKHPQKVDLQAYGPKIHQLQLARAQKAEAAYLAKAAAEKGATKTASGIVITTLKAGTGANPKPSDTVKVHYHGTLIDGTVFDSSVKRGEPATFGLSNVIKCWTEGVQQIKAGGKSKLVCPSDLAYGERGAPPSISPGSTLVFEVELLEIVAK